MVPSLSFGFFRCWRGSGAGRRGSFGSRRFGVLDDRDLGVFELDAGLAFEHGATFRERGRLVGLLGQLALGVGLGVRAAVLDQLQESVGALALHARGTSAERRQLPRVSGLHGGAFGRRETQPWEICGNTDNGYSTVSLLRLPAGPCPPYRTYNLPPASPTIDDFLFFVLFFLQHLGYIETVTPIGYVRFSPYGARRDIAPPPQHILI